MPILGIVDSSKSKAIAARFSGLVDEPAANMEYYYGMAVLSDGSWAAGGADTSSNWRWIVNKYNTDGSLNWQRAISLGVSNTFAQVTSMDTDGSDNVFAYGATKNPSGGGESVGMVLKYSSTGSLLWQRQVTTSTNDIYCNRCFVKKDANDIWITGYNNAGGQAFIHSYDSSGNFYQQIAITGNNPRGVALWRDSGYNTYVGGYRYTSPYEAWVAKFNSSNSLQWARLLTISGNTGYQGIYDIVTDSGSNVYALFWNDNGTGANSYTIVKWNSSGTLQWQRQLSRGTYQRGLAMTIDSSDNIYVVSYSGNSGWQYVTKHNSSGTLQWQRQMPYAGNVYGYEAKTNATNLFIGTNQYLNNSNAVTSVSLLTGAGVGRTATINGYTGTYAAGDLTDSAGSLTISSWSPSIGTPNGTSSTPSVTNTTTSYSGFTTTISV